MLQIRKKKFELNLIIIQIPEGRRFLFGTKLLILTIFAQ